MAQQPQSISNMERKSNHSSFLTSCFLLPLHCCWGRLSLSLSLSWFSQPCHGRAYTASPTIVMIVVLSLLSLFILSYFLSNFLFDCILVDESGFGGLRKKKIFVSGFGCLKGWSFGGGYVFEMGFCVRV